MDRLNRAQILSEGQHASPGKQRHSGLGEAVAETANNEAARHARINMVNVVLSKHGSWEIEGFKDYAKHLAAWPT